MFLRRRAASYPPGHETSMNVVSWVSLALVISTVILFSFGQTIAISVQWRNMADRQLLDLSADERVLYQKAVYVSSILFVANMGCAKISMSIVIQRLFTGRLFECTSYVLAIFTAGWTLSGVLATAFQCHIPTPWDLLQASGCIDIVAFGNYLASTNIMTEILLVLVPLAVWTQSTPVGNRLYVSVISDFLSVIAAVGTQLYFFNAAADVSSTADDWAISLCMQVAQTLSVISACLPGLHPLIAKEMNDTASVNTPRNTSESHWDSKKYGSLSTHKSHPSVDSNATVEPIGSPYCRPLATHGLVRSSPSCDSYNFPHLPSNVALPLSTLEPPVDVFNRLIRSSSSLDLDPLGTPKNVDDLGCLPAPDWDEEEVEDLEAGRASPDRRPTSDYVFQRSKVISVPEDRNMFEIGKEWNGFVPPLPTPGILTNPPRAF
ncbi:hypothetical protein OPT61_g8223 [Boeremia exigua]|uniref:Uncharacterized protein n=1 Tax=Boeremia exigua TaxID=749465 RepID=A0ACC2HZ28_9PLEO|nr:hypothetical protein OPT61_g8223 [Boeremia exigua]